MSNNFDEYLEYLYVTGQLDDTSQDDNQEDEDEIDEDKTLRGRKI